jgi:hypothetical protein
MSDISSTGQTILMVIGIRVRSGVLCIVAPGRQQNLEILMVKYTDTNMRAEVISFPLLFCTNC